MKLVLVEWIDSHSGKGWRPLDEMSEPAEATICRSVGWLASDEGECKVIVPHISGEKNDGVRPYGTGELAIPKKAIRRVQVIRRS